MQTQCYVCGGKAWTNNPMYIVICDQCKEKEQQKKRPPIGLYPRFLHDEKRLDDVTQAILRYIDAHKVVPAEWWEEYNELAEREQKRKERG